MKEGDALEANLRGKYKFSIINPHFIILNITW